MEYFDFISNFCFLLPPNFSVLVLSQRKLYGLKHRVNERNSVLECCQHYNTGIMNFNVPIIIIRISHLTSLWCPFSWHLYIISVRITNFQINSLLSLHFPLSFTALVFFIIQEQLFKAFNFIACSHIHMFVFICFCIHIESSVKKIDISKGRGAVRALI